jgi:DNA-binding NarL/FixJ family response regulator
MHILLADDQAKVRSALRLWLSRQAGIEVLGEAVDATGVLDWVTVACPDVILLDWELPGRDAADLVSELRSTCPGLAIVALSGRTEAKHEARLAQVDAFVSKGDPPEHLLTVLEGLHRGSTGAGSI